MADEKITDEMLKQRCLDLGYSEEQIDRIIYQTNAWSLLCKEEQNFFARLFGSKYDDEEALKDMIENWECLLIHETIKEDRAKHPEDYYAKIKGNEKSKVNINEMVICSFPSRMNEFQYRSFKESNSRKKEKAN